MRYFQYTVRHLPLWAALALAVVFSGCKKLVHVDPPVTSTNSTNAFAADATAIATMNSAYAKITNGNFSNMLGLSLTLGLYADEISLYNTAANAGYTAYFTNSLANNTLTNADVWTYVYPIVYIANFVIEGVNGSASLTPAVKQQLTGEAEFMRAFCYFYLTNLYGDVPLVISTNYSNSSLLPRVAQSTIYQQIIRDLKDAQGLLAGSYPDATLLTTSTERVRPTKWAATALLARVYLYIGDFANAEAQATSVIGNTGLYGLTPIDNTFKKNQNEDIWQLQPTLSNQNTAEGRYFILPISGPDNVTYIFYLNKNLVTAFETNDLRKTKWIGSVGTSPNNYYYANKYKVGIDASATSVASLKEYETPLRLGEQYLIRAEARAQQNNIQGAQADIDSVRSRAGLGIITASTKTDLLTAVFHERQTELFTEWGHRWLDLKRTNSADAVMGAASPQKGGAWNTYKQLFPVPLTELQADPNLTQNNGY